MLRKFTALLFTIVMAGGMQAAEQSRDIKIVKSEDNYLNDCFGIEKLSAKNANEDVGEATYTSSKCRLNRVEVKEEFRNRGIGSQLFKAVAKEMSDCKRIRWWAVKGSEPFYEKLGAQIEASYPYSYTDSYTDMVYNNKANYTAHTLSNFYIQRNFYDRPL